MKKQGFSTVHLPIKLSRQDLELTINQLITGVVYEDSSMEKDNMMVTAKKIDAITIEIDPETVRYKVCLDIWIKKGTGLGAFEAQGVIAVEFSTSYEINKDWQVSTMTEVSSHEWLKRPKVRVGIFDIPIKSIANRILKRSKQLISQSLDHYLANNFNLRHHIQKGWDLLQEPILISEDYSIWLTVDPANISMAPIAVDGDEIIGKIIMKASTIAVVGERPPFLKAGILPSFEYSKIKKEGFQIHMPTLIAYKEAQKMVRQQLIAKTFTSGRRSVTVRDIALCGQDDKIVIKVQLSGSFDGSIHITGRLVFDKMKNQLALETTNFELATSNVLVKSLAWLFQKRLKRQFEKAMKFPLKESLDKMKALIHEYLQEYSITKNIVLKAQLGDIEVHSFALSEKTIDIHLGTKGGVSLEISGFTPMPGNEQVKHPIG